VGTADRLVIVQNVVQVCLKLKIDVENEHVTGRKIRLVIMAAI
jgi:hypothetical protein